MGEVRLKGVAFRSSRAEPFGEAFLRRAVAYREVVAALRAREVATADVCSRVKLTKTPEEYAASGRRELPYEAVLASGRRGWAVGTRVRVYRSTAGAGLLRDPDDGLGGTFVDADPRDYDVEHYVRVLRETYAARLERAFAPGRRGGAVRRPHAAGPVRAPGVPDPPGAAPGTLTPPLWR
jgi:DNA polymerase I